MTIPIDQKDIIHFVAVCYTTLCGRELSAHHFVTERTAPLQKATF
ncbi:hypothetical protein [Pseudoalteromonas rubra]|nr:hypothetical protein [Pseudoalteromonas rubra]MEC4087639.1 hypothetical protein [Pseudoalteromonas rubra]